MLKLMKYIKHSPAFPSLSLNTIIYIVYNIVVYEYIVKAHVITRRVPILNASLILFEYICTR